MRRINPNMITSLRLVIFGPLACFFLMQNYLALALISMVLGELTDLFDGMIARRTNQISELGKIYDPMCDSVFHIIIWISFLAIGWVQVYFVILFFARDLVVSNIRTCLANYKIVLAARTSGKIKAWSQALAQLSLITLHLFYNESLPEYVQLAIVSVAAIVTAYSFVDYVFAFYKVEKTRKVFIK